MASGMLSGVYFAASTTATAPTKLALNRPGQLCICWQYVKRRIPAYPENYSVEDLEQFAFRKAGFKRYNRPVPGAIALYQPNTFRTDAHTGHVGVVESVDRWGAPTVATSGENIPKEFADAGCPNVAHKRISALAGLRRGVSFWRKS